MKTLTLVSSLLLFSACANSYAEFYTGNTIVQQFDATERIQQKRGSDADLFEAGQLRGFVMAVSDDLQRTRSVCYTPGVTVQQLVAIVGKEAKQSPEMWNLDGAATAMVALMRAFPCKK